MGSYPMTSEEIYNYIQKVFSQVESDLSDEVKSLQCNITDDSVQIDVEFLDDSKETFDFDLWRFTMRRAYLRADADIIVDTIVNFMQNNHISGSSEDLYSQWIELDHKMVYDYDGFTTDYTLYKSLDGDRFVCIFGDKDLYYPENTDPDFECETEREAREWFEDYEGFGYEDEDIENGFWEDIKSSQSLANTFERIHDKDEINWQMHDYNYDPFYEELKKYLRPGETWDAEDEYGYPADTNVSLKTLFSRMPEDTQIAFLDRFWIHNNPKDYVKSDWNIEDQIDAPEAIGKLNPGDKFVNRNGVEITIVEPAKDGRIQYNVGDECRIGSEKSIQQMLYRNNYIRMSQDIQATSSMNATDVVRWMYEKHPEFAFYDESDHGDEVELKFEISSKHLGDLTSDLDDLGIKYTTRGGRLRIYAPEDSSYDTVESSTDSYSTDDDSKYWYFTTHGVQPGSVPKGLIIYEVVDKPEGSYFSTNRVITTEALKYYDIKERAPR